MCCLSKAATASQHLLSLSYANEPITKPELLPKRCSRTVTDSLPLSSSRRTRTGVLASASNWGGGENFGMTRGKTEYVYVHTHECPLTHALTWTVKHMLSRKEVFLSLLQLLVCPPSHNLDTHLQASNMYEYLIIECCCGNRQI